MQITSSQEKSTYVDVSRLGAFEVKAETSIKRNVVKQFISAGTGSTEMEVFENDENVHLSDHLLQLKTSCSGVKKQIKQRQMEQYKVKDETLFAAARVQVIQEEKYQLEQEIEKLKKTVEQVKLKKFNTMHSFKSYEHVLERMKKDDVKNQIKRNQLEKQLKIMEKQYKQFQNIGHQLREYEYLSIAGLKEAQTEVNEQISHRKAKLNNINDIVEEKHVIEKKKQERKYKSDMIKQMAAGDLQDSDLIRMKKFLAVQIFLKHLLKSKIEKLKELYEPYENAFFKIKYNTNVKDAGSLKSEYHNFQNSYNDKSAWVKHLEEQISKLQVSRKELNDSYRGLKDKQLIIFQALETKQGNKIELNRKELQKKAQLSQIKMMTISQWLKVQSKRIGIQYSSPGNTPQECLREICQNLILKRAKPVIQEVVTVQEV